MSVTGERYENKDMKILLLEDDKSLNRGITLTLEKAGYQVDSAFTLAEAEERLESDRYALIICDIIRPKFEAVLSVLEKELGGLEIGEWTKPLGGYFISFEAMEGCAKEIVAKCKELGVVLTGAGATFPYGKDPKDSNIRIAPTYPTAEEMAEATDVFVLCVKLVSVEKLLQNAVAETA